MLSNPGKKKNHRKSSRIILNGWIEMELTELHLACYRRIQRAIEQVLRTQVEQQSKEKPDQSEGISQQEQLKIIQSVLTILLSD